MVSIHVPSAGGNDRPTVSIGLPVFNGEQHLSQALDSLLRQTFSDFELVISDNSSTDGTRDICERFVRQDLRVRYVLQPRNIGAPRNWNFVVHQAKGQYFKWASANDYCNERFVEECLNVLKYDPRLVLSFGTTCLVDDELGAVTEYQGDVEVLDDRPSERFNRVSQRWALNNAQCGLLRLDVLRRTRLDRPYIGGDLELMLELALHGRFKRAPDAVLFRRVGGKSMSVNLSQEQLEEFIDPLARSRQHLVAWPRHWDRLTTILRSPIGTGERLVCTAMAARAASWDRARLLRELATLLRRRRNGVQEARQQQLHEQS